MYSRSLLSGPASISRPEIFCPSVIRPNHQTRVAANYLEDCQTWRINIPMRIFFRSSTVLVLNLLVIALVSGAAYADKVNFKDGSLASISSGSSTDPSRLQLAGSLSNLKLETTRSIYPASFLAGDIGKRNKIAMPNAIGAVCLNLPHCCCWERV